MPGKDLPRTFDPYVHSTSCHKKRWPTLLAFIGRMLVLSNALSEMSRWTTLKD